MIMKKVCCIILNYNDHNTVCDLLSRITCYSAIEKIFVIDNCSSDNSFDEIRKWEEINSKVKCYRTEKNGGYGYGNNYGIQIAHMEGFEYAIVTNPDVYFTEELIMKLASMLDSDKMLSIATAKQKNIEDKEIERVAWKIPTIVEAIFFDTIVGRKIGICKYNKNYLNGRDFVYVDCVPGAFFMTNINNFINSQGYDEEMFLFCEETTIAIRMKNSGYKTGLLCNDTYKHAHSISINKEISKKENQERMIAKNRLYIMHKYLNANPFCLLVARFVYEITIQKNTLIRSLRMFI